MAIISKIRDKSWLIVGFVGVAMLAFILGDYNRMFGTSEGKYGIGLVGGEKVDIDNYNILSERVQSQDRGQKQQENKPFTDDDVQAANDKAFNFMVDSTLLYQEYATLKLDISDREFTAYLMATNGFEVLQDLNQFFVDKATGVVSEQSMKNGRMELQKTLNKLKTAKKAEEKAQWEGTKKYFTDRRKTEKYFALVSQGIYVTKVEAREEYLAKKEAKNIRFVARKYMEINDAEIKVSEEEIQAFFNDHKQEKKYWNRTNNREIRMFDVSIKPSTADTLAFDKVMAKLRQDFQSSQNDSILVMKESDMRNYLPGARGIAVPEGHPKSNQYMTYPMDFDTVFKRSQIGQLVGPYRVGESFYLSKLMGFSPAKIKARHLLISTNKSADAKVLASKKKTADSLLSVITKTNFAELVQKYSEDPGSKDKGGEYADFLEGDMVKEFGGYCATAPIGKIGLVKTDFGYHIIEVLERDANRFPVLVTVVKSFKASEETIANAESEANVLLGKIDSKMANSNDLNAKLAVFDTLANQQRYFVRPITLEDNNPTIYGLTTQIAQDRIYELAYNEDAEAGDLIQAPIRDKDKYVIAMLASVKEKGAPEFYEVKERMKKELIEEKKAKRLMNEMAKVKGLDALAKKFNSAVEQGQITFATPSLGNGGYEPEIVGALFSHFVKDGQTTLPLKGKSGVYVIQIVSTQKAPATAIYKEEKDQLTSMIKGNIQGLLMGGLRKSAEVVDNRKLFPRIRS